MNIYCSIYFLKYTNSDFSPLYRHTTVSDFPAQPIALHVRMSKRQGEYVAVKRFRLHDFLSLYTRVCFPHR